MEPTEEMRRRVKRYFRGWSDCVDMTWERERREALFETMSPSLLAEFASVAEQARREGYEEAEEKIRKIVERVEREMSGYAGFEMADGRLEVAREILRALQPKEKP